MNLFRRTSHVEAETRLQAVLHELDEATDDERRAADDLVASAEHHRVRIQGETQRLLARSAERDQRRAAQVRSGEICPVTARLRGLLEEIDRGRR